MLVFTENRKIELTRILSQTRRLRHAESVYSHTDLEKAETDIYRMIEAEQKGKASDSQGGECKSSDEIDQNFGGWNSYSWKRTQASNWKTQNN